MKSFVAAALALTVAGAAPAKTDPRTAAAFGTTGTKSTTIDGTILHVVSGRGFDVVYSGSKRFTEHYVRRGDRYVLAEGESQMETC